jgi:hypothetical protein
MSAIAFHEKAGRSQVDSVVLLVDKVFFLATANRSGFLLADPSPGKVLCAHAVVPASQLEHVRAPQRS